MAKLEFRLLRPEEIEIRVGSVSKTGATLLFYKDARCDQNILDETVGPLNWQRHHSRDNANCIVSIWDDEKLQWIEKEDTGTESYTEKEKGLASDSFKRACFNWGIGRELYTAPKTRVECPTKSIGNNRYELEDKFQFYGSYVSDIEYEDKRISAVTVCDQYDNVIFTWPGEKPKAATKSKIVTPYMTEARQKTFLDLCEKYGVDYKDIGKQAGARGLKSMTEQQYGKAMIILREIARYESVEQ